MNWVGDTIKTSFGRNSRKQASVDDIESINTSHEKYAENVNVLQLMTFFLIKQHVQLLRHHFTINQVDIRPLQSCSKHLNATTCQHKQVQMCEELFESRNARRVNKPTTIRLFIWMEQRKTTEDKTGLITTGS